MLALALSTKMAYANTTGVNLLEAFNTDLLTEQVNINIPGGHTLIANGTYPCLTINGVSNVKSAIYNILQATGKFKDSRHHPPLCWV